MTQRRVVQRQGGSRAARGSAGTVQRWDTARTCRLHHSRLCPRTDPPIWAGHRAGWRCATVGEAPGLTMPEQGHRQRHCSHHGWPCCRWDTAKQRAAGENRQEEDIGRLRTPKAHGATDRNHHAHNHKPPVPHRQSWDRVQPVVKIGEFKEVEWEVL